MHKLRVDLDSKIYFRIKRKSPKRIRLKSFRDNFFINPIYYKNSDKGDTLTVCDFHGDIFIETSILIFEIDDPISEDFIELELGDYFPKLTRYLRWLTRETSINHLLNFVIASIETNFDLEKIDINAVIRPDAMLNMNVFGHLISLSDVKKSDKYIGLELEIPVYEDILLDAKYGLIKGDNRKVILYAAMAIESMLGTLIDKAHKKKLSLKNSNLSRVKITTHEGDRYKDPIYARMKNANSFSLLLHELPLYVLDKSLQSDDQELYKEVIKLYKTRNKLVHEGVIPDEGDFFEVSSLGAILAYRIAINVFHWMGIKKFQHFLPSYYKKYEELE